MDHLGFGRRTFTIGRHTGSSSSSSSHKGMRQNLDRMESTVTAIPHALIEYMDNFNSFCLSGIKFASLLETMFQDTPVLLLALRFREACEQLNDKCVKSSMMLQGEVVPPITKKLAPSLGKLRSRVDSHAKALSKHESYVKQLEQLSSSQNPNKQKMEQVEVKFKASATDFSKEDALLAEARNDVQKIRVEVMGSCFLSFLEAQSKLLTSASELIAPLGVYKEVGKGLSDTLNGTVKEATVGWLAAAQVNQNLRSFGSLSRNDVQCMLYNHRDGLPGTISRGLNAKVDQLLKKYATALKNTPTPHHKVAGGFHLNPKGIELALRDCCSELEAIGAGAPHAETKDEKEEQIIRDVPRVSYKIVGEEFGCAMGENVEANIAEKKQAILKLIQSLPHCSFLESGDEHKVEEFASHVLNETCTTVTNTAAKTAVQLVFGKANLVFVRPSPLAMDNHSVVVRARQVDSSVSVVVKSSWWLVEDYAAFSMLNRVADPSANLGVVDVDYILEIKLQNFIRDSCHLDLPSISVTYRQSERPEPVEEISSSPHREGGRALHTINRTLKNFLSMKGRPHDGHDSRDRSGHHTAGGRGNGTQEAELAGRRNGNFLSYIKDEDEEVRRSEVGVADTSSSSSSPMSHSPGGDEEEEEEDEGDGPDGGGGDGLMMGVEYSPKPTRRIGGVDGEDEDEDEEEEEEEGDGMKGKVTKKKHSYSYLRKHGVSSGWRRGDNEGEGSGGNPLGGPRAGGSSFFSKSFDRTGTSSISTKPYHPIRRHGSNESMSSQSTLVAKQLGGDNDTMSSITDILRPSGQGCGLTLSNIQDHIRKENSRHYQQHHHHHHHHPHHHRRREEEEEEDDEEEEYGRGKVGMSSSSRRTTHHRGGRRGERRTGSGRKTKAEAKEEEEEGSSMVSPSSDRVGGSIASDSEVQSVIDLISSKRYESGYDNEDSLPVKDGGYLYPSHLDYTSGEGGGHLRSYEGSRSGRDYRGADSWTLDDRDDVDARGGGGQVGSGEDEDKYVAMSRERNRGVSSKPSSNSPLRGEGEGNAVDEFGSPRVKDGGRGGGKEEQHHGKSRTRNKKWDLREDEGEGRSSDKDQPEISDVFRKGFGQLFLSDPGEGGAGGGDSTGGMKLLRDSPGYQLGLSLYNSMKDDSDSERSGRDSNPPVSSSSSEPQSPLSRTRSSENVGGGADRSLGRDEDHFSHAPGTRHPAHSRPSGGGPHFPSFKYDDRPQFSGSDGGLSNSQDSGDAASWDLGVDQKNPSHYYHQYDYNRGSYDSAITHSQERPHRPLPPRAFGSRSLDDYSQPTGPMVFDRRGDQHHMVLSGPPPLHGGMRPGPPNQFGPHPPLPPHSGPNSGPPGPMPPHMAPMSHHHGHMPPPPPRGVVPPPFHPPPPGHPPGPHPHMNGGPPPPGHGPHPPWYDYDGPRGMRGPRPPSMPHHDNRFRPVQMSGGRSNTPSDAPSPASMHSMSPGPSPHPTPPHTPPPPMPHHQQPPPPMMPPGGPPHPPGPGMRIPPACPPLRGGPWDGPPREFRPPPPMPHNGIQGPPMNRPPLKVHPQMPMYNMVDGRYSNWMS